MDLGMLRRLAGTGLVTAGVLALGAAPSAAATEIAVDCGAGSDLQAAINAAPKGAILDVSGRCVGSFTVGKNLTLRGVSAAVPDAGSSSSGPTTDATLTISSGNVKVKSLTITGANTSAFNADGGLVNLGTATLVRVTVQGNTGNGAGALTNRGTLTLQRTTVQSNESVDSDEAILNAGSATIEKSTIRDNDGTGIASGVSLTLIDSTVSGNHADADVGGIRAGGTTTIVRSTIAGNVSLNGEDGAGITNGGTLTITESTVVGNDGDSNGAGLDNVAGTATVASTIIAGNTVDGHPYDCTGTITSNGYNLIGTRYGLFGQIAYADCDFGARSTDEVGGATPIDPLLKPLGSYGGPTQTMVPKPASPAVDKIPIGATTADGTTALCPSSGTADQRGIARPQNGACDIGSVERKPKE